MAKPNIDPKNLTALIDKVVGLNREVVGHVLQKKSWIEAGEAQQAKGTEKLRALREQAKADMHSSKARVHEEKASGQNQRQRAAQS